MKKKIIILLIFLIILNFLIPSAVSNDLFLKNYQNWDNGFYKKIFKTSYEDNNSPIIRNPNPENQTIADITISALTVYIEDYEGDKIDWSIETSPNIGKYYGFGETNGTKTCHISGLQYSTTYYWFVNATDPFGSNIYTKKVYVFIIEEYGEYIPTIAIIHISVLTRNILSYHPIPVNDNITNWTKLKNKVRVEWVVDNPNHISFDHPDPIFNFRIREWQVFSRFPSMMFIIGGGRIQTDEDWEKIKVPIRNESFSGSSLIDVELLEKDDMVMLYVFLYFNRYLRPSAGYSGGYFNIIFN